MPIPAAAALPDPSVDGVRRLLARHLPEQRVTSVVPLGRGLDNAAFDVDGELVVRCSTHPDPGERSRRVLRESRLLATVAATSPLPVPVPRFTAVEDGCLGYARLPGRPLLDLPGPQRSARATAVGAALGGLLAALSALPPDLMADLAGVDDTPPREWLDACRDLFPQLTSALPGGHVRAVQAFLDAGPPEPAERLVFTHNDLGIEHVLVGPDSGGITGILDWGDAAVADPAHDLGLVLRDLGEQALDAALTAYGVGPDRVPAPRRRIDFHARCALLEDLAHGLDTGRDAYVEKSLRGVAALFPA